MEMRCRESERGITKAT